ncbi:hypothetical protein GCM10017691_19700 [Pseudonocardia petroleophila]|uniref:Uncharacterized protein n=1 Tax=Pseudonocardia petroleophila TaxID=37331 RepID=A0A7G7MGW1_9PSEU|nr:hypothetical protein [Pseudonocardia petroleophila]QNG52022.1 hypothetical protein H6H00_28785 [Pseudonocardia petroleophila]
MTPGPPTPAQVVQRAGFESQAAFNEAIPIVKIPVAGPAPFNMLAVVRSRLWGMGYFGDDLHRAHVTGYPTALTIPRFDPGRPEQHVVHHSTSVGVSAMAADDDVDFTVALDSVASASTFDRDGTWLLSFDSAVQFDFDSLVEVEAGVVEYVATSWVLFVEPPPPPGAAPDPPTVATNLRGWAHFMVHSTRHYATLPGADVMRAAAELTPLVRELSAAGQTADAQAVQQASVDVLEEFSPAAAERTAYLILRAEAKHNLIARMIENKQLADVGPLAGSAISNYQAYTAAAGADLARAARDLGELVKPLLTAGLPAQALAAQRANLDTLRAITTPTDPLGHDLALAESEHNVVARLIDAGQTPHAAPLVQPLLERYLAYAGKPAADILRVQRNLTELAARLASAHLTSEAGATQHALNQLDARA